MSYSTLLSRTIEKVSGSTSSTLCLNRKLEFVDSNAEVQYFLPFLKYVALLVLSPSNIIVAIIVFYANIGVSVPFRCFVASLLFYKNMCNQQKLDVAAVLYKSAYVDTIPEELYDENMDVGMNSGKNTSNFATTSLIVKDAVTPFHRTGMKMSDCIIEVIGGRVVSSTSNDGVIPMTFHIKVTHKASCAKWHVWRQLSDFIYIRQAMSLDLSVATEMAERVADSSVPTETSNTIVSRLLTRTKTNESMISKKSCHFPSVEHFPTLPPPLSVVVSVNSDAAFEDAFSDANVSNRKDAELKLSIHRRQIQVWGWLLQIQEIPECADHAFFREFLGMLPYDPSVVVPNCSEADNVVDSKKANKKIISTGTTLNNFKFVDVNPVFKYMFRSCKDTHGFTVRGKNYKADGRKINPGSSITELVLLELYEVDTSKGIEKYDHIASQGKVKKRVEALTSLADKPFVFVVNFQIPGDPPVSIVTYYVLPRNWMEIHKDKENIEGFKKVLDRFMDLPNTEAERMAMWDGTYIKPEPKPVGTSVTTAATDTDTGNSVESQSDSGSISGKQRDRLGACFGVKNLQSSNGDHSVDEDSRAKTMQRARGGSVPLSHASHVVGFESEAELNMSARPTPKKSHSWNPFKFGPSKKSHSTVPITRDGDSDPFETPLKDVTGSQSDGDGSSSMVEQTPAETGVSVPVLAPTTSNMNRASRPPTAAASTAPSVQGSETASWKMKVPSDITWPEPEEPGAYPSSDFRNQRFKLIPAVSDGPWVVVAAVRSKPALLGQKVVQKYFKGENYMEIDVFVGSSVIASQIVSICRGYGKHFTINIGIVIQGEDESELPERMLMCCTQNKLDVDCRVRLEEDDDE